MKSNRDLNDRKNRIIARGEVSDHSHIIIGECDIYENKGLTYVKVKGKCAIKHLIESVFIGDGIEEWTEEHFDIDLTNKPATVRHGDVRLELVKKDTYLYKQQREFNPYTKAINRVRD